MNVLLQNPAILLILVVVVARFVGRRFIAGKKNPAAPVGEESERTRQVREEVARKIAERRRGEARPPVLAREQAEEPPARVAPNEDIAGVLAEQQRLVDQIRVLDGALAPSRSVGAMRQPATVPAGDAHGDLLRELGDPGGARRAMVLREVLGAPRGLTVEGCLWRQ